MLLESWIRGRSGGSCSGRSIWFAGLPDGGSWRRNGSILALALVLAAGAGCASHRRSKSPTESVGRGLPRLNATEGTDFRKVPAGETIAPALGVDLP